MEIVTSNNEGIKTPSTKPSIAKPAEAKPAEAVVAVETSTEKVVPLVQEVKKVVKELAPHAPSQNMAELAGINHFTPQPLTNYIQRKVDKDISFWCEMDKETRLPRKPVALIGESGSGKNFAVTNYAAEQGLPLLIVPCDDSQVLKELLGFWKAANGTTMWCEGLLSQFLRQPCVVLFDEVNCLPAGKLFMLHELLQNRKLFLKDAPADMSMVSLHQEARLFIAMNPPEAKYSGTNRLNTALANRAAFIEVRPFRDDEILTVKTGSEKMDAALIQFYREASRIIKEQKLRVSISKRNIDTIATALKSGLDVGTAVMQGFVNSALATASQVERDVLMNAAILVFGASKFDDIIKQQVN